MSLKQLVQKVFLWFGFELRRKCVDGSGASSFSSDPFEAQQLLMRDTGKADMTILDVGANKGQTAIKYRMIFPSAEIYCFEAYPASIAALKNRFSNDRQIHVVPKAVARETGTAVFYVNKVDATNSLLARPTSSRRYYPKSAGPQNTIEVDVVGLDDYFSAHNKAVSQIDILKLDIQGGELNAFHGAKSLLETGGISLIFTEVMFVPHYEGAPCFHEVSSFLANYGYSLFDFYNLHRATNGQLRYGDALFVSECIRRNVINKYPDEP